MKYCKILTATKEQTAESVFTADAVWSLGYKHPTAGWSAMAKVSEDNPRLVQFRTVESSGTVHNFTLQLGREFFYKRWPILVKNASSFFKRRYSPRRVCGGGHDKATQRRQTLKLTKAEMETVIRFDEELQRADIYTHNRALILGHYHEYQHRHTIPHRSGPMTTTAAETVKTPKNPMFFMFVYLLCLPYIKRQNTISSQKLQMQSKRGSKLSFQASNVGPSGGI